MKILNGLSELIWKIGVGFTKSSFHIASPEKLVDYFQPEWAQLTPSFDKGLLKLNIEARVQLCRFPEDVQLKALTRGLNSKRDNTRLACAELLSMVVRPQVLSAMRQHINNPDSKVAEVAKSYVKRFSDSKKS